MTGDLQEVSATAREKVQQELERLGVKNVRETRDLNRLVLQGTAPHGPLVTFVIKAKTQGTWQATIADGDRRRGRDDVLWVFVDLGAGPDFFVVRDRWIREDISQAHDAYLQRHGGQRAEGGESDHHAIQPERLAFWQDRWELIGAVRAGR